MDVDLRRKPWSAPRLRGRGEQGNIVIRSQSLSALCVATFAYTHNRAQPDHTSDPILGPAYHSLASEARSTVGQTRHSFQINQIYEHTISSTNRSTKE